MTDADEHGLVVKALNDGLGNCVMWDARSAKIVRENPDLRGLTPTYIKNELISYVRRSGGAVVVQVREDRENWVGRYHHWYKVILPLDEFKFGLFIEMRLTGDDDPDFPEVTLVNAHPQLKL
jgi:hypothetical protein